MSLQTWSCVKSSSCAWWSVFFLLTRGHIIVYRWKTCTRPLSVRSWTLWVCQDSKGFLLWVISHGKWLKKAATAFESYRECLKKLIKSPSGASHLGLACIVFHSLLYVGLCTLFYGLFVCVVIIRNVIAGSVLIISNKVTGIRRTYNTILN